MKKIFYLIVSLLSLNLFGAEEFKTSDTIVDAENKEFLITNNKYKTRKLELKNGANVLVNIKYNEGLNIDRNIKLLDSSSLIINAEINNSKKYALNLKRFKNEIENSSLKVKSNQGGVLTTYPLQLKNSTLDISADKIGLELKGNTKTILSENSNLKIVASSGIKGGEITTSGNIKIYSKNIGIETGKIDFKDKSTTFILSDGTIGLFTKNSVFEKGSKTFISASNSLSEGIKINKENTLIEFKEGSETIIIANKGIAKQEDAKPIKFESGSEEIIIAGATAIYETRLSGKTKLIASAHNVFGNIVYDLKNSVKDYSEREPFVLENGSILNGNIVKPGKVKIELSNGAKFFIPERLGGHFILKGDLYIGPREAYEKNDIKEYIINKVKNSLNHEEFEKIKKTIENGGGYKERNADKYYTVIYKRYEHRDDPNNVTQTDAVDETRYFDLQGGRIHFRVGGKFDSGDNKNDKLILKDINQRENTKIELTGIGAEIVIHPTNLNTININDNFDIIEEINLDKDTNFTLANANLKINDLEIGPIVFSRKDKIIDNKYIISLQNQGKLSPTAIKILNEEKINHKKALEKSYFFKDFIFDKKNKNSFWMLAENNSNINNLYLGYEKKFSNTTLGGLTEISKLSNYGIYSTYNLDNLYLGALLQKAKTNERKSKYEDLNLSLSSGYKFSLNNHSYIDTKFLITIGKKFKQNFQKQGINIEMENMAYLRNDLDIKYAYKFTNSNIYARFGVGKHLIGKQKITMKKTENLKVNEVIRYNEINKRIAFGGEFKLNNHIFNTEISKFLSKNYKSKLKFSITYSYKF